MQQSAIFQQGLDLLYFGMGTVFVFLAVLVVVTMLVSLLISRFTSSTDQILQAANSDVMASLISRFTSSTDQILQAPNSDVMASLISRFPSSRDQGLRTVGSVVIGSQNLNQTAMNSSLIKVLQGAIDQHRAHR